MGEARGQTSSGRGFVKGEVRCEVCRSWVGP